MRKVKYKYRCSDIISLINNVNNNVLIIHYQNQEMKHHMSWVMEDLNYVKDGILKIQSRVGNGKTITF